MAGVLTAPLGLYYFASVAPGGLLANLILVPIAVFFQIPAILLSLISFENFGAYFAGGLEAVCETLGEYLGGLIWLSPPFAWQVVLFIIGATLLSLRRSLVFSGFCFILISAPYIFEHIIFPSELNITYLAVGQGDATLIRLPDRKNILIDAGPSHNYLLRALRIRGIKTIDIAVLSHPDLDHINGFFEVFKKLEVRELWHSGFDSSHILMRELLKLAHEKNIYIRESRELLGSNMIGNANLSVLYPSTLDENASTNNNSLVLKLEYSKYSFLWSGDLEKSKEIFADSKWQADVLKAPHHGSKSSSSEHFINSVKAKQVIFQTGSQNHFGFPHVSVKKRWLESGAQLWDTGTQGQIYLEIKRNKLRIVSNIV